MWFLAILSQNIIRKMQNAPSYQEFPSPHLTVNIIKFPLYNGLWVEEEGGKEVLGGGGGKKKNKAKEISIFAKPQCLKAETWEALPFQQLEQGTHSPV